MKIKRLFGLATLCSLAVLATACGKKTSNENIVNSDIISAYSKPLSEVKEELKPFTKAVTVFAGQKIVLKSGYIVVTKDDDNYYVYNLKLKEKKIITIAIGDISDIDVDNDLVIFEYPTNELGDNGYEAYLLDGTKIFEKAYPGSFNTYTNGSADYENNDGTVYEAKNYYFRYENFHDGDYETVYVYYHTVVEYSKDGTSYTYYNEDDFEAKFGKFQDVFHNGAAIGLEGYDFKYVDGTLYIYKKSKLVNIISTSALNGIISNGSVLYQSTKQVSKNDKYDFFLNGAYYTIQTFKRDILSSKITEVKNFKFYITNVISPFISNEEDKEEIKGFLCEGYDFSSTKDLDSSAHKPALITGDGKVSIHERLKISGNPFVQDGDVYYDMFDAVGNYGTIEYNKKGEITNVYDGLYYDGIVVRTTSNNTTTFTDKDGKTLLTTTNSGTLGYNLYYGTDAKGKSLLVEIKDGNISTFEIGAYEVFDGVLLSYYNIDSTKTEFYVLDTTHTKIDFELESTDSFTTYYDDEEFDVLYYKKTDASGLDTLVYFE